MWKKKPKWARRKIGLSPALCTKKILVRIRKILGLNDCSLRRPPCEGSTQGAGGQPKTELHRPKTAVAVTTATVPLLSWRRLNADWTSSKVNSSDFYFGVIFTSVDKEKDSKGFVIVFIVTPKHDSVKRFFNFFKICRHPPSARREEPSRFVVRYVVVSSVILLVLFIGVLLDLTWYIVWTWCSELFLLKLKTEKFNGHCLHKM